MDDFLTSKDGALVGASIAGRKGWKVGQTVDLTRQLGLTFVVKGIFASGNEEQDNTTLMDISYVQDRFDARGVANTIMIKLAGSARADDVAARIDALPKPVGTMTQAEKAYVSGMIEDLSDLINVSRLVILITLAVVFVSVANTVSMSVRDRTKQIGVMRTLGFRRLSVLVLVTAEAAILCLAGGVIGVAAVWLLLRFQSVTVQARNLNLEVAMPIAVVLAALAVAAAIGIAGSFWPAWRASRLKIVDCLGSTE